MHAPAGCGLCCAVDRRFARDRATGGRAGADPGAAKRDPLELPLRFHGELFGRAEGRERSDAMPERQCREALLRLSAGREGGHARACRQASGTACHSGTCGSSGAPSGSCAGGACDSSTGGSRCSGHGYGRARRNETGGSCRINAASGAGTAGSGQTCSTGSEKRCETSSECTTDRRRPACRDRGCAASGSLPWCAPSAVQSTAPIAQTWTSAAGRVVACLQANAASLSPTCQSGLAELGR